MPTRRPHPPRAQARPTACAARSRRPEDGDVSASRLMTMRTRGARAPSPRLAARNPRLTDDAHPLLPKDEGASNDLANADIVTKYRCAGDIASRVLAAVVDDEASAKVLELCQLGDQLIEEDRKVYNQKKEGRGGKGIAFPTCVSLNHCVGHYSPLSEAPRSSRGDIVKSTWASTSTGTSPWWRTPSSAGRARRRSPGGRPTRWWRRGRWRSACSGCSTPASRTPRSPT